jgi:hypothetical protein
VKLVPVRSISLLAVLLYLSAAQEEWEAQAAHPHSKYRGCKATFRPSCERPRDTEFLYGSRQDRADE